MIFNAKNFVKVQQGTKTQTRRLAHKERELGAGVELNEMIRFPNGVKSVERYQPERGSWRMVHQVGQLKACQPGRGKRGDGSLLVIDLRYDENVTSISDEDVKAEGYESRRAFLAEWVSMHDPDAMQAWEVWNGTKPDDTGWVSYVKWCSTVYPECYRAWVIEFQYIPPIDARKEFLRSMDADTPEGNATLDRILNGE